MLPGAKPFFIWAGLWAIEPAPAEAACDNCPQRRISLYDFEVTVPRPDSVAGLAGWYPLFFAGPGAGAALFDSRCASFIDAGFYRDSTGVPSNSLTVGIDHPHTAPEGNIKGLDYLLAGTVSPDGAGFRLDVSLECACNRKEVHSASGRFDRPDQASAFAADLAAREFAPIAETIRRFEREERDRNPEVSIGGYNAELTAAPLRRKVSMGEKVPITFTLFDCDGTPLAGRTISLTNEGDKRALPSYNGSFAAAEAVTGSDGKVTVDFTVGSARGPAMARAYFFHKTPFGCEAIATDEAPLEVEGSAAYYQVRYEYGESETYDFRHEENPLPSWTKSTRTVTVKQTLLSGSAIFKNTAGPLQNGVVELEGAGLEGGLVNGSYSGNIHTHSSENYADDNATIRRGGYEQWNSEGAPYLTGADKPDFFVSLRPEELQETSQFGFTLPFLVRTGAYGHSFEIITGSGKVFDTSASFDKADSSEENLGPSVKFQLLYSVKDSVFHIDADLDTAYSEGETRTTLRAKLRATVTPIAIGPKSDGVIGKTAPAGRADRLRFLDGGAAVSLSLQDVGKSERVRITLHGLDGKRVSVLYDGIRGPEPELTLKLGEAPAGLRVLVLRSGNLRESRLFFRNPQ